MVLVVWHDKRSKERNRDVWISFLNRTHLTFTPTPLLAHVSPDAIIVYPYLGGGVHLTVL